MSPPPLVIGAPVWNRSWALPAWFDSVRANCEPDAVGLIFVVPPSDAHSREVIDERGRGFAFVEVLRDKYEQFDRAVRRHDNHTSLAAARNMLITHVCQVGPEWFLSWDSDLLVSPGVLPTVMALEHPVTTVWTWLNRTPPKQGMHWDEQLQRLVPVEWNEPVNATAMAWDPQHKEKAVAVHLDPLHWDTWARGCWRCDVALAWQLMRPEAYRVARYGPHPHGEDLPFNWTLERRGIERWCYGEHPGVHLFDRSQGQTELQEGYPAIMRHAADKPLAATRPRPQSESLRAIGYFPRADSPVLQA